METYLFIGLCLVLSTGQTRAAILGVDAEISQELVSLTKNVTFTCTIRKSEPVTSRVEVGKYLTDDNGDVQKLVMNSGGSAALVSRFEDTGRYTMTLDEGNTEDVFTVKIVDITEEDNAPLGCREVNENEWATAHFQVRTPANNAAFDGYGYEEVVQFEEGVPKALGCTVMGGSPAPDVEISTYRGNRYTSEFTRRVNSDIQCGQDEWYDNDICLMWNRYTTTLHTEMFEPRPEDHDDFLECSGSVVGLEAAPVNGRIRIDLLFKPAFFCENDRVEAAVGDQATLTCRFDANPDVNEAFWRVEEGGQSYDLQNGGATPSGQITASVDLQAKEMSLRFLRVTEEHHAVETYTMVAVNDRGTTEKDTYLTDVGAAHPGAASTYGISLLAVVCMALIGRILA